MADQSLVPRRQHGVFRHMGKRLIKRLHTLGERTEPNSEHVRSDRERCRPINYLRMCSARPGPRRHEALRPRLLPRACKQQRPQRICASQNAKRDQGPKTQWSLCHPAQIFDHLIAHKLRIVLCYSSGLPPVRVQSQQTLCETTQREDNAHLDRQRAAEGRRQRWLRESGPASVAIRSNGRKATHRAHRQRQWLVPRCCATTNSYRYQCTPGKRAVPECSDETRTRTGFHGTM
jgi:hypothetical protein